MNTQGLNLFIIDDNPSLVIELKSYLTGRFGLDLNISTFSSGESALEEVNENTRIVILDYYLGGRNGNKILKLIKAINPETEVIMLSSNEDIAVAIDSFRKGAKDYVIKGNKSNRKIISIVYNILAYPIRVMVREFGISKYLAIFLMSFVTMGIVVWVVLKYFYK